MMSSASNTLFLLILISTSVFHCSISQQIIEVVSGSDDNVSGEMSSAILKKFRFLLGFQASEAHKPSTYSPSPAPTPVEETASVPTPAPVHLHTHHIYRHSYHNLGDHKSSDGRRVERDKSKARRRTVIVAVLASIGSVSVLIFCAATFLLVCRRSQRKRAQCSNGTNKVSYDPDPCPQLFCSNYSVPTPDIESSCKNPSSQSKNELSNESIMSGYCGEQIKSEPEIVSNRDEKVRSLSQLDSGECTMCESDAASCLDEEIFEIESSSSDDDESFHSVCNSCLSVEPASSTSDCCNLSCSLGKCSPFHSSNGSISPICKQTPPLQALSTFKQSIAASSHINGEESHQSSPSLLSEQSTGPSPQPSRSLPTKIFTMSPQLPLLLSVSNENIRRPPIPPPPPIPSVSNGSIPKPPPPPLPPMRPPSAKNGCNSRLPPPPPPLQLQQNAPVGKNGSPLPKLKPLHWDKVRAAPDRTMVWDKIRSSSFELDEQMIESLFGYNTQSSGKTEEAMAKSSSPGKHVLDNKRLQNITILLKALNATAEQVCEALIQGGGLGSQQLEAITKMEPTKEEEDKLSSYQGDENELGSAERFVKAMLNVPFAFSRIQVMLFKETFEDEVVHLKKSFAMLEEACSELRSSRLFFRLLEAVLKTGNRMNLGTIRGGARAFKLDTLLKLADVKGTDGKTTLLHFVVQEIIRSEGINAMEKTIKKNKPKTSEEREEGYRVMGLDIVSGLSTELCNVKKTASVDLDVLASSVANLKEGMNKMKHLVEVNLSTDEQNKTFVNSMKSFLLHAEVTIRELKGDEDQVLVHVREITEYYHGNVSKDEVNPLRIFVIVRDFLGMLDRVCKEVRSCKGPNSVIMPFR